MTAELLRVVTVIADYGYLSGACFAADQTIADQLGLSRGSVNRLVARAEAAGIVSSEFNPRTGTMSRTVTPIADDALAVCVSSQARDHLAGSRFKAYCFLSVRQHLGEATSVARIARGCSMKEDTARAAVGDLLAGGWVSRVGEDRGAYIYVVHPAPVAGVATQLPLDFPLPRQVRRPPADDGAEDDLAEWLCPGQLDLLSEPVLTPPVSVTAPSPDSITAPTPVCGTQTGSLDQDPVNMPLTVDGGCSREAATSVTRDTRARGLRWRPSVPPSGSRRPLRGEQRTSRPSTTPSPRKRASEGTPIAFQRLPEGLDLALAPAIDLWRRITHDYARGLVAAEVRDELNRIAAWTGQAGAQNVLAERLEWRLAEHGGPARVTNPVGWLLRRGLPRRGQRCGQPWCDGGVRLDTGAGCQACEVRAVDARALRQRLAVQLAEEMPSASVAQRRAVLEQRLREHTVLEQARRATALEQEEQARARAEADRPRRLAEAAAAEATRQALPCADCGTAGAAGLCESCRRGRNLAEAISQCINVELAARADLRRYESVREVWEETRSELREARRTARHGAADEQIAAASELLAVQHALGEYRARALQRLAASPVVVEEADRIRETVLRSRHRYESLQDAREAAEREAAAAASRTARYVLDQRLATVVRIRERISQRSTPTPEKGPNAEDANQARARLRSGR
ncbi:hypothetical protein ACFWXO_13765 [Kitasatospora sp. NPDC059088]|uniref:hypothetical protein n=1 Tax=Kitasatospora sp. NPDC059088 TaxID=3346722 RepID=UPI0036C9FDEA